MPVIAWLLVAIVVACIVATFVRADELEGYRPMRSGEMPAANLLKS